MTTFFDDKFRLNLDDTDSPGDVIDALALAPFCEGAEPWARTIELRRVRKEVTLIPTGFVPARSARVQAQASHLVTGPGWTLVIRRWHDDAATLVVTAVNEAIGQAVLDEITLDACEPPGPEDSSVTVAFWHRGSRGPVRHERSLVAAPWSEARVNYAAKVAQALDELVARDPERLGGKLLLLHGPPGTGKTSALRTLAIEWREWCSLELVLDPERLFGDAGYLMSVALGDESNDEVKWRLLVLEDCDELIRSDAKSGTGQALARLLNVTDGMVGQGLHVLVAITTNEPVGRLHPAVVRAGRCLAEVEVGLLSPEECDHWLGRPATAPSGGMSLADLAALANELAVVREVRGEVAVGQYL